jgi:protein-tyrosine phosphatase
VHREADLMVDVHCHILPDIDDGARSWEIAESMCALALADGIGHIVATPHANSRYHYDRGEVFYLTQISWGKDWKQA